MKIALCSDTFLPVVDGVGRVVYEYALNLAALGHECYVITPIQHTEWRGSYPFEIVDYLSIAVPTAEQYRTGVATLDPHYIERVNSLDFDVVHAHSPGTSGIEAVRLASKLKVPLVGTFHSKYYDDFMKYTKSDIISSLGVRYVSGFYERCSEVWTVSENAAETLRSYGYRGDIRIMRNGIPEKKPNALCEQAARAQFSLPDDKPIMLFVGQIDNKKNIFLIVEAAALLKQRGRDFRLVFAGQGKDEGELLRRVEEAGLADRVTYTGHIFEPHLLDGLYMASDLFVFPSLYDTAGLVVTEAAAMGTPSLVLEKSAPAEIVRDMENGLVCAGSAESLCDGMEKYLFGLSDGERERIAENARATLPEPWPDIIRNVEARYEDLCSGGALPSSRLPMIARGIEARRQDRLARIEPELTDAERERILTGIVSSRSPLRLKLLPTGPRRRMVALDAVSRIFTPGREYTEQEVGELLAPVYRDANALRRALVEQGYLARTSDCRTYWLAESPLEDGD